MTTSLTIGYLANKSSSLFERPIVNMKVSIFIRKFSKVCIIWKCEWKETLEYEKQDRSERHESKDELKISFI